jgi:hypothetical protein
MTEITGYILSLIHKQRPRKQKMKRHLNTYHIVTRIPPETPKHDRHVI